MEDPKEHRLDEYLQAARSQRLVVSFEEVRRSIIDQSPSPPALDSTASRSSGTSVAGFKSFFNQKINIVYTAISLLMVGALIWTYLNKEEDSKAPDIPSIEEKIPNIQKENQPEMNPVLVEKDTIYEGPQNEKEEVKQEDPVFEEQSGLPELNRVDSMVLSQFLDTAEIVKEKVEDEPVKPHDKRRHEKFSITVKQPYAYTFTPITSEAELRKLQEDLKKEGVELIFTTLKYKKGMIEEVTGTIALEGYFGTFTTDEFEDFTFKWNYSKLKAGNPDNFDIIINTPMKRKSNTAINIDEIE